MNTPNFNDKHLPLIAHLGQPDFKFNLTQWLHTLARQDMEMALEIIAYAHQHDQTDHWLRIEAEKAKDRLETQAAYQLGNQTASQQNPIEIRVKNQILCTKLNPFDAETEIKQHLAWQDGFLDWVDTQLGESW